MALFKKTLSKLTSALTRTREAVGEAVGGAVEGVVGGVTGGFKSLLRGRKLDAALIEELEAALIKADVGVAATKTLIDGIRADWKAGKQTKGEDALAYMKRELKAMWPEEDRRLRFAASGEGGGPTVILVAGINGAGKTTSIAKLCYLMREQGKTVMLAACDTFRAGAVKQLEIWAERLGVDVIKGQQGGDPAAVAFDACQAVKARKIDVLIIDTAGRLHTQDPLMRQLTKIRSVVSRQIEGGPHETILVLDATSGQNALRQAEEFTKAIDVTGIFLAKLDGTARGGAVVAIRSQTDIPVKFVGTGERPEDVAAFDPDSFVEALFEA